MEDKMTILCVSNSYERKFYLNPDFESLPDHVKDELKIMCVLYTEDVGGILTLVFEENGELCFEVTHEDNDFFFLLGDPDVFFDGDVAIRVNSKVVGCRVGKLSNSQ